jgi:hypothetical protein
MLLNRIIAVVGVLRIIRLISKDLIVQAGTTVLQRDPTIADGVNITIEDTGELLVL